MAQNLSADRPIYGLSHIYHSDFLDEEPESIEWIAAKYLSEVRQVQPEGPYHLCGFSAGGLIAYEMARQLLDAGATIGSLTLIEPTLGKKHTAHQLESTLGASNQDRLTLFLKLLARSPLSLRERTKYYFRLLTAQFYFLLKKPLPEELRWVGYLKSLGPAMRKFTYHPINCSAILLYGYMNDENYKACSDCWNNLLMKGVKIQNLDDVKQHDDFMLDHSLKKIAELIEMNIS
ncbi:MAG: hypothetical protein GY727_09935 [Gammaproteobacteria bacterium]|nr:hypothetical protein [Gammaproteobacteria bacterium]MCP4090776.1 hypothetical protein [Gammaproteobacteria bacterium]MCP4277203.1 hypothetical protein [Gammaproteobacteria bacterium]MCP4832825.1 hypothetical protein [Gammaproteobacteria bacterium]MCP4927987.1 hypothetical protein [Gammaproteobacteria bacterium]